MFRTLCSYLGLPALAASAVFLTTDSATAGGRKVPYSQDSGGPYPDIARDSFYPGFYGYDLDDRHPTYYGGARYREYYNYGRLYNYGFNPNGQWYYDKEQRHAHHPVPPLEMPPPLPVPGLPVAPPPDGVPAAVAAAAAQPQTPSTLDKPALLAVEVPADAEVWLEGAKTRQTGASRLFVSPPLSFGDSFAYEVRARWLADGKPVEQTRKVVVKGGDRVAVKFPTEP